MKEKTKKAKEIIEKIKDNNPKVQWETEIKAAMAVKAQEDKEASVEMTNPMGIDGDNISGFESLTAVREKATEIIKLGKTITQFVRPGERKLLKVAVNMNNGEVQKKFERNHPVGAIVAFTLKGDVLVGWSKYNKTSEVLPFSKKIAVETAVMRGLIDRIYPNGESEYITGESRRVPTAIAVALPNFLKRVEKVFDKEAGNVGVFIGNA